MNAKGLNGLKAVQFGLFLIILGFCVVIFALGLIAASAVTIMLGGMDALEASGKLLLWGLPSILVGIIVGGLGKMLCVGAPEEGARNLIVISLIADFCLGGLRVAQSQGFNDFMISGIVAYVLTLVSYVTFLKFLTRMGDNLGEPRVGQYVAFLYGGIGGTFLVFFFLFVSWSAFILAICALMILNNLLYNYTIFTLFRAMPLYIEEVKMGITDALESGEERAQAERKARLSGGAPGGGPSLGKEPEEPKGDPPEGHLLYRIPKGLEPLHMAVKEGDKFKTELRLSQGDNPRAPVRHGLTPMHLAASVGVMEVADALLKAGAPIDETCEMGLTPLYFAVQTGNHNLVGFFLNKGANVFHQNEQGYTPLHWACSAPHPNFIGPARVKMVTLLISQGADVNAVTNDGQTPRDIALSNQLEETIACLERYTNTGTPPPKVFKSVRGDEDGDIEEMVTEPAAFPPFVGTEYTVIPKGLPPLFEAVKDGEPEKVERQLAAGGQLTDSLEGGIRPIHITAITGVMAVTEMLIRYGANVDDTYDHNLTSMFLAVHRNNYNMVGYLVSRGANPNHQDDMGRTPLHWAAAVPEERLVGGNRVKMVKFLLDNGADASIKDKNDQSAMDLAAAAGLDDIVTIFEDRMASAAEEDEGDSGDEDEYYV